MKKSLFTLVELIIVITILAILSVSAFLVVSQRIGKSRDSRRLSDLNTIEKALGVSLTSSQRYPLPDNYVTVYISGTAIGYQGKFCDTATAATSIKSSPKDPLDNGCYTYYTTTGGKNYQLMGMLENSSTVTFRGIGAQGPRSTVNYQENLQFSNSACTCNSNGTNSICSVASLAFCLNYAHASEVSAADYSVRIPTTKGESLGIIVMSGTNQLLEETGTGVDLATSSLALKSVFSSTEISSGTGGQLIPPIFLKNSLLNQTVDLSRLDNSLYGWWDMETTFVSGGQTYLKDFSKEGNHGVLNGGIVIGGTQGIKSKATAIVTGQYITTLTGNLLENFTMIAIFKTAGPYNTAPQNVVTHGGGGPSEGSYFLRIDSPPETYRISAFARSVGFAEPRTSSLASPVTGSYYHMIVTYDGQKLSSYLNGVLQSTVTKTGPIDFSGGDNRLYFGKSDGSGMTNFLNGAIDEIRIYNRVFSSTEVQNLYTTMIK